MTKPTAEQMVAAIAAYSTNNVCKAICQRIVNGDVTLAHERGVPHGAFLTAVLHGNYDLAMQRADADNMAALKKI